MESKRCKYEKIFSLLMIFSLLFAFSIPAFAKANPDDIQTINGVATLIITKSISRFARNTAVMLETVRIIRGWRVVIELKK